jgi:hypothetical protein
MVIVSGTGGAARLRSRTGERTQDRIEADSHSYVEHVDAERRPVIRASNNTFSKPSTFKVPRMSEFSMGFATKRNSGAFAAPRPFVTISVKCRSTSVSINGCGRSLLQVRVTSTSRGTSGLVSSD